MSILLKLCLLTTLISISISVLCIFLHLLNYRKPLQQRLVVRILLIIPIYSTICYMNLVCSRLVSGLVEPIKEIYEAFVLYMFYCLLTDLLGGERNIIVMASGRAPVVQPFPMNILGKRIDISDPESFLLIKRSILQYVWLKPLLCLLFAVNDIIEGTTEGNDSKNFLLSFGFWINLIYNISVSMSLYNLALFWKCLYGDLHKFNPWGKFLCVKLIIFASYWQGIILAILNYFNYLNESSFQIQNALLCFELVGFSIGHWCSFNFKEYTVRYLGNSARLSLKHAIIDVFGYADLIYDFKITFQIGGKLYNFKKFESVDNNQSVSIYDSETRLKKLNQGLRYYNLEDGKKGTYWLNKGPSGKLLANSSDDEYDDDYGSLYSSDDARTLFADSHSITSLTGKSIAPPRLTKNKAKQPQQLAKQTKSSKAAAVKKPNVALVNKKLKSQLAPERKVNAIKKNTRELYQLDNKSTKELLADIEITRDEFIQDNKFYIRAIRKKPFGDDNYPVIYDEIGYIYSNDMRKRRLEAYQRQSNILGGSNNNGDKERKKLLSSINDQVVNGSISGYAGGYGSLSTSDALRPGNGDGINGDSQTLNGFYRV